MSDGQDGAAAGSRGRGRGRGKSRGGFGKYLRARGRGRGAGRPAEFNQRLLLEGEGRPEITEEEEEEIKKELTSKYGRRQLGTNADRYKEEEVELDSDGEPIRDPEVDLSAFLEKQRISEDIGPVLSSADKVEEDEDDIDTSLAHISSKLSYSAIAESSTKKGKVQQIVWDDTLDEMAREKKAAEATWNLKERFRAKSEKLRSKPITPTPTAGRNRRQVLQDAPALPLPEGVQPKIKTEIEELEDFLDDLLP